MAGPTLFSDDAVAVLRGLYPDVEAIRAALPALTVAQIRRKACKLGIAAGTVTRPFTDDEDAILVRLYPDTAAIRQLLPHRDRGQIERRAWRIKATKPQRGFTAEEDAVLRRLFPDLLAVARELPDRSMRALDSRAKRLGLTRQAGRNRRYLARELRLLRIFYPHYDLLCALLAPRGREAIKRQACAMGLSAGLHGTPHGISRPWTPQELEAAKVYGAEIPGRTAAAIDRARYRNRIKASAGPAAEKRRELVAAREAEMAKRRAERKARSDAMRPKREAAARARRNERKRRDRALKAEARRSASEQVVRVATVQSRASPPVARIARPKPAHGGVPTAARRRVQGAGGIAPHVLSAAGRSVYGIELVALVQRTVPRDLWPHVKPLVIEDLTMAVVEGRCTLDGLSALLPGAIKAVMAEQFGGPA